MNRYFITSDNVKLHYLVNGNGENPVVILPGMGQPADSFSEVMEGLGSSYTFYVLDYRCHGQSEDTERGYHTERFAMDVKEMLQDAGLKSFRLIAHSMGNAVAWAFFEMFGQKDVISYVLEEEAPCLLSSPAWPEETAKMYRGLVEWPSFTEEDNSSVRSVFMGNLFHDHVNRDWRQEVAAIHVPTLIIMGTKSHYGSPSLWSWLQQTVPNAKLTVLEGGHMIHGDCPEGFLSAVKEFLAQTV